MSILGRERQEYSSYAKKIRNEYCHVDEHSFNTGRATFLKKILIDEKKIFGTEEFQTNMEHVARLNIQWEISELERGL